MILAADNLREFVHRLLHNFRTSIVKRIYRFTRLEVCIGILRRSPHHGTLRSERAPPVIKYQLIVDHRPDVIEPELFDLHHLGRGPETIKEVKERYPRIQS